MLSNETSKFLSFFFKLITKENKRDRDGHKEYGVKKSKENALGSESIPTNRLQRIYCMLICFEQKTRAKRKKKLFISFL